MASGIGIGSMTTLAKSSVIDAILEEIKCHSDFFWLRIKYGLAEFG
ncbi:MAG: hypothetical protein ACFFC1_02555 [Promethearchaeota archaeon]